MSWVFTEYILRQTSHWLSNVLLTLAVNCLVRFEVGKLIIRVLKCLNRLLIDLTTTYDGLLR